MDQCIFANVRKANRVLFRRYQDALAPTGISIVQLSMLRTLERHGALPLSRLADHLAMERTSLYRTIEPLIEFGAVKIKNANKGKSKIAELTPEGQATIEKVMPYWAKAQEGILKEISCPDWQTLCETLNKIANLNPTRK